MKNNILILVIAMLVMACASCTSVRQTAPVMGIAGNNIVTNVKADLDYDNVKRIKGSATTKRVLWIFNHTTNGNKRLSASNRYKGLSQAESVALYRAKSAADVDVVLEPQFEVETKSYFFGIYKRTQVNVVGWGVNIKSFKEGPESNNVEPFSRPSILF